MGRGGGTGGKEGRNGDLPSFSLSHLRVHKRDRLFSLFGGKLMIHGLTDQPAD